MQADFTIAEGCLWEAAEPPLTHKGFVNLVRVVHVNKV